MANGSVTGVAGGTATITAVAGEETVECIVTVTGEPWVSDANPERYEQVDLFNSLNPDLHLTVDPGSWGVMKNVVQCSAGMGGDMIDAINESNIQTYQRAGILLDITEEAGAISNWRNS